MRGSVGNDLETQRSKHLSFPEEGPEVTVMESAPPWAQQEPVDPVDGPNSLVCSFRGWGSPKGESVDCPLTPEPPEGTGL